MSKTIIFQIALSFFVLNGCVKHDKLILKNENFLTISDSLIIPIDSLTLPNSNSLNYRDSLLMIPNEGLNTLSILNIGKKESLYYDFKLLNRRIKMHSAWFQNKDSFFIYNRNKSIIYLINRNSNILDSFSTQRLLPPSENITGPGFNVSTSQVPYFCDNKIYYSGISIGENSAAYYRYVLGEISKDTIKYYVNFPEDYSKKNLGGIYYRITYHTIVDDSLINISFPASNDIAIFNIFSKQVVYKKLYPEISDKISPFNNNDSKETLAEDHTKIAGHFYGQYSFKEIIYDSYRKIFYRVLSFPGNADDMEKKKFGKQESYILVYDKQFNYLGCKLLQLQTDHGKYFVTQKGLYILKKTTNENELSFYLYSINDHSKQL